jgi:hypothetical protein
MNQITASKETRDSLIIAVKAGKTLPESLLPFVLSCEGLAKTLKVLARECGNEAFQQQVSAYEKGRAEQYQKDLLRRKNKKQRRERAAREQAKKPIKLRRENKTQRRERAAREQASKRAEAKKFKRQRPNRRGKSVKKFIRKLLENSEKRNPSQAFTHSGPMSPIPSATPKCSDPKRRCRQCGGFAVIGNDVCKDCY